MACARSHLLSKARPERGAAAALCLVFVAAGCAGQSGPTKALAAGYMAIARPANHRLELAVDSYNRIDRSDLAVAKAICEPR